MHASLRLPVCVALLAFLGSGCGSQPIPLVAVAGTTISLTIPYNYPTGFGNVLAENPVSFPQYGTTSALEDPQRGELTFSLYDEATTTTIPVGLRYITKVGISPTSRAALDSGVTTLFAAGQVIAFLDIPLEAVPVAGASKAFLLQVKLMRRDEEDPDRFVEVPVQTGAGEEWLGWGDGDTPSSPAGIPITVLESPDQVARFTPFDTWIDSPAGLLSGTADYEASLLVPYPHLTLRVPDPEDAGAPNPAAWEISFTYPADRMQIRGVVAVRRNPSAAYVSWTAEEPPPPVQCGADGTLRIQVVDPDGEAVGVDIAYQRRNFDDTNCNDRIQPSDLLEVAGTFTAYDEDGSEIQPSSFAVLE